MYNFMITVHNPLCTLVFMVVTVATALFVLEKHLFLRLSQYNKSKIKYLYQLFMPNTFCIIMFIFWGCTPYIRGATQKFGEFDHKKKVFYRNS